MAILKPDYLVCLECDSPCYQFESRGDQIYEALCEVCGNEDLESFTTQDEIDAVDSYWDEKRRNQQQDRQGRRAASRGEGTAPRDD